jgi:predicted metal-dependent hydrolase
MENKLPLYSVFERDIKYPRLEFKTGNLVLIVPKNYGNKDELISRHKKWIQHKHDAINDAIKMVENKRLGKPKSKKDLECLVRQKVRDYCQILNTSINNIYLRKMRTKWGSCSHKNNLTLNSLLAYLPEHLIEYVIFHEIAHTKDKKHAENFWNIVERKFKDHEKHEMELFGYWFLIQKEMDRSVSVV